MANIKVGESLYNSQYVVSKSLGEGGEGAVYIVHLKDNPKKKYAAKVFHKPDNVNDEYWRKRSDEVLTSLRISKKPNPNLAQTYDVFTTETDEIVLIMEYIDGITLKSFLAKHSYLAPKVALTIFRKLLNGIQQLHSYKQKIIHRDLKPENIMISYDLSRVVIIDFGTSSVIKDNTKVLTLEKDLHGTVSYILPDLVDEYGKKDGNPYISVQSDFFSLGVILYEMIMGSVPFTPVVINNNSEKAKVQTIGLPRRYDMINISANPTIPPTLENIIYKCIVSKPKEIYHRYTDVQQIIDDVERCMPLLDKKTDNTLLLKPVNERFYQRDKLIDIDTVRTGQTWYKQWYFFVPIIGLAVAIIVLSIIFFFII